MNLFENEWLYLGIFLELFEQPSNYQSNYLDKYSGIFLDNYLSNHQTINQTIWISIGLSIRLFGHLSDYLSDHLDTISTINQRTYYTVGTLLFWNTFDLYYHLEQFTTTSSDIATRLFSTCILGISHIQCYKCGGGVVMRT